MIEKQPIDAVITWVDGDDPAHQQKLNQYLESIGRQPKSADTTRFRSLGEIDYCVASIIHYAPFIRRIFIVTDNQTPELIARYRGTEWENRIIVVDHKTVFRGFESALPTFNSLSIESVLFRIPELAEHFIYFNDDVFLLQRTQPQDFFVNGKPLLRGRYEKQSQKRWSKKLRALVGIKPDPENPGFKFSLERSAQLLGKTEEYFRIDHTPHPLRKSTFEQITERLPHWLAQNVRFPLRSAEQVSSVSLANHVELEKGADTTRETQVLNLKPKRYSATKLQHLLNNSQHTFSCIQSLDQADEKQQQIVLQWLNHRIPMDINNAVEHASS